MADESKAKAAKERLAAAKKAAEDAEVVAQTSGISPHPESSEEAREHAVHDALNAAEEAQEDEAAEKPLTPEANATTEQAAMAESAAEPAEPAGDSTAPSADGDLNAEADVGEKKSDEAEGRSDEVERDQEKPATAASAPKRSFAAQALLWIGVALVISVGALWAAPRVAPHLPAWAAPVAAFFMPGSDQASARIAEIEETTAARIAALTERLDVVEAKAGDDAALREAIAALETRVSARIDDLADEPKQDLSALEASIDTATGRVTAAEAKVEGLRAEIDALAGVSGENAAPSAETLARVAAFGAAVEGLRAEIAALSDRVAMIDTLAAQQDVSALTARVDALEGGEAATSGARTEADEIRRQANIDAALTRIEQALASGASYSEAIGQVENLSGELAPGPLASVAGSGAPTTDSLIRSFGPAAQNAYAAALSAEAGDGFGSRLLARLEGRIGGRPAIETEGDDAGAVLSRIEARLGEGRLAEALTEAKALPADAGAAMAGWIAKLETADAARRSFTEWRSALDAN